MTPPLPMSSSELSRIRALIRAKKADRKATVLKSSASMTFERGLKMPKDDRETPDVRKPVKNCEKCGQETLMGVSQNSPLRATERWDGRRYVRFCGPECEKKGGW